MSRDPFPGDNVIAFPSVRPPLVLTTETGGLEDVEARILDEIGKIAASAPEIDEASDEYVQTDERAFRRRFGFDAHKHRREQVIRLKHEADLTDREIRALNRTRSLEFKGGVAKISAPLFVAAWGRICLAWLFAMMLLAFAQAQQSPQPVATVIWKLIVVLGGLGLFGGAIVHFYIWPRQLLNRVRSQAARQASTTDAADRQDS